MRSQRRGKIVAIGTDAGRVATVGESFIGDGRVLRHFSAEITPEDAGLVDSIETALAKP